MHPSLYDHSIAQEFQNVLLACASHFGHECVHVEPLGRYGYTTARLFKLRFDPANRAVPYVIKIDTTDNALREMAGVGQAHTYLYEANGITLIDSNPKNGYSGILYQMFSADDGSIVEMRDVYLDQTKTVEFIIEILDHVYDNCSVAHSPTLRTTNLGNEYEWYLRAGRPDRVVEAYPVVSDEVSFVGASYVHPAAVLEQLITSEEQIAFGCVHGDLHPNNIVLNPANAPALIDFAWWHSGDVLKDYALMECSIRFLLFPFNVEWDQHRWVTTTMLSESGADEVFERYSADTGLSHREDYLRMAATVAHIRKRAELDLGSEFDFGRYLVSQFLMLYGLSKLETYPFMRTLDTLGAIGTLLHASRAGG
jgi:hypothetical protein